MTLMPDSVRNKTTESLLKLINNRFDNLNISQLIIDLESEQKTERLSLWLEMFGIDLGDGVDFLGMNEFEKRNFIRLYLSVLQLSGTPKSIINLCLALGATSARIEWNWKLAYNSEAKFNAQHKYDEGYQYQGFAIDIIVGGVSDFNTFKTRFKRVLNRVQPVRIYLRAVISE